VPKPKSITSKEITVKFTLKRLLVPVLAIAAIIVAALLAWKFVFKKPITLLPEQKRSIAVTSFENQTGDQSYDYLSKVIPNLLITNLEQSGYFSVTTWERLRDLLKQAGKGDVDFINSDLGFELCLKDAVQVIVLGSVTKAENTFVIDAKVLDVGTKRLLATANSRGDGASSILKTQVDDLSRLIAKAIGFSDRKAAAAGMQIEGMTTNSLEAYNYYIRGQEEDQKLHGPQARQCYEKAVELDPNFAMALLELGGESIKKAMALSKNVTDKERFYIEARYASQVEKDRPKAASIYRQIVDMYPKEKRAFSYLGGLAQDLQETIVFYGKALELDPSDVLVLNGIGYAYLGLKQYDQAVEAFKKYAALRTGEANPFDSLADACFHLGRLLEALDHYRKALQLEPSFYGSIVAKGYIYAFREDYTQAREWVDKAVSVSVERQRPNAYLWKAFYLAWLGSHEKSLGYIRMAEDALRALGHDMAKAYADWLRAWVYYDQGQLELCRSFNETSISELIKNELYGHESFHRIGHDFLAGLLDLEERKTDSAKSKLAEMDSPQIECQGGYRDLAAFESEYLKTIILLYEKAVERALSSFQKSTILKFVPQSVDVDYIKFRYNTPFQRDVLARAFAERGEIDRAIALYEHLITFDPTKPSRALIHLLYHYRLGKLYEQKGLKDKAKAQLERFLDLWEDADPGRPEVEDAKKRLAILIKN
jgi:tetratricopeptide (TPR) repeat protein